MTTKRTDFHQEFNTLFFIENNYKQLNVRVLQMLFNCGFIRCDISDYIRSYKIKQSRCKPSEHHCILTIIEVLATYKNYLSTISYFTIPLKQMASFVIIHSTINGYTVYCAYIFCLQNDQQVWKTKAKVWNQPVYIVIQTRMAWRNKGG